MRSGGCEHNTLSARWAGGGGDGGQQRRPSGPAAHRHHPKMQPAALQAGFQARRRRTRGFGRRTAAPRRPAGPTSHSTAEQALCITGCCSGVRKLPPWARAVARVPSASLAGCWTCSGGFDHVAEHAACGSTLVAPQFWPHVLKAPIGSRNNAQACHRRLPIPCSRHRLRQATAAAETQARPAIRASSPKAVNFRASTALQARACRLKRGGIAAPGSAALPGLQHELPPAAPRRRQPGDTPPASLTPLPPAMEVEAAQAAAQEVAANQAAAADELFGDVDALCEQAAAFLAELAKQVGSERMPIHGAWLWASFGPGVGLPSAERAQLPIPRMKSVPPPRAPPVPSCQCCRATRRTSRSCELPP